MKFIYCFLNLFYHEHFPMSLNIFESMIFLRQHNIPSYGFSIIYLNSFLLLTTFLDILVHKNLSSFAKIIVLGQFSRELLSESLLTYFAKLISRKAMPIYIIFVLLFWQLKNVSDCVLFKIGIFWIINDIKHFSCS